MPSLRLWDVLVDVVARVLGFDARTAALSGSRDIPIVVSQTKIQILPRKAAICDIRACQPLHALTWTASSVDVTREMR